jgi:drug/metabolite transporter (DMT)-like permease
METRFREYLALNLAVLFWGFSFVATKIALESFTLFTLIFTRFALASFLFLIILTYRGFPRFSGKDHAKFFIVAFFEPGLYFVFETIGLQHTTAPKAALIIATVPVVVMIFAALFLGERTKPVGLLGMGISLVGILILVVGDRNFKWSLGGHLLGDLLIFGAVVSAALYIVSARRLGKNHSALEFTTMQIIYGAVLYAPAFLWELPNVKWMMISSRSIEALAFLTFFSTAGAFLCYNYALSKVPATKASVFINGIPVVTAFGAWIILGEKLTLMQAWGGVLVLLGVFLTNFPGLKSPNRKPERISMIQG